VFGGTVSWLQKQRAELQIHVEGEVRLALGDADLLQRQQKWKEAAAAAERAKGLIADTTSKSLKELVNQRSLDLTLAAELDQIYMDRMVAVAESWWSELGNPPIDKRYAEAFKKAGIDVHELSVQEAAEKIRERGISAEIAAALDNWTTVRAYSEGKKKDTFWKKLQELATAVDPDPYRVKLRGVEANFNDPEKILDSPQLLEQPMPVIMSLALSLLKIERREGRYEKVLRELQRRHPQDFWVNFELGADSSNPVDAVRFSTVALSIRPEIAAVHSQLGVALKNVGRLDDAIASFREAKRLKDTVAGTHEDLGEALVAKGQLDEAVTCFREAIRLRKVDSDGPWHVAEAHIKLGTVLRMQKKWDEAIAEFRKATEIDRDDARTYFHLGIALSIQGNWEEALNAFEKMPKLYPKIYPEGDNALAWFWATCPVMKLRDPARAVASSKKAVKRAPNNGEYWNTLGVACYRNGEWKAAIEALTRSMELRMGGDSADYFFLAMAHRQLADKEKARTWYNQAVAWTDKNKPQDEELKRFRAEATELLQNYETEPELVPLPRELP
jgi:tetratricopeptide (TPR) repeat protein